MHQLTVRADDQVYRYGGEEFMLLMNRSNQRQAAAFAERIRAEVDAMEICQKYPDLNVSASFGVAEVSPSDDCVRALFHRADQALYIAKASGRNQLIVAPVIEARESA